MIHQVLEKLLEKGLQLHANTPVSSVSSTQDAQGKWTVTTPRGAVKAGQVIYATNAYTPGILPEYQRSIIPTRGICSHITTPQGTQSPHLVNSYALRHDAGTFDYLIPRTDGSIIVGGARQRFWHNRERWYGNVRDDELVGEAVPYFDDYMQRHFRGWEESGAVAERVWTGSKISPLFPLFSEFCRDVRLSLTRMCFLSPVMGYSSDFVPHVGEVPNKPGQFIIGGFSGHGMPAILLCGKGLAAMVRDGVPFERTGLPRVFKTTWERISASRSPLGESLRPVFEGVGSKL